MPSRLELAPLPSAQDNEETAGCWLTSPLERHIEIAMGAVLLALQIHSPCLLKRDSHTSPGTIMDLASPSHRAHSRGTVIQADLS